MTTPTIARSEFQSAIESGIDASPDLSESHTARLREVGRASTEVCVRSYRHGPGCPIFQAGMYGDDGIDTPPLGVRILFTRAFDNTLDPPGDDRECRPPAVFTING